MMPSQTSEPAAPPSAPPDTAPLRLGESGADDTAQIVFAILARKAAALGGLRSLSAWLHRVTMLQCRNAVRRRRRERRSELAAMESAALSAARDPLQEALPYLDAAVRSADGNQDGTISEKEAQAFAHTK
jgi:DNA-directed RNA polymerase specialized sigma24 family protein